MALNASILSAWALPFDLMLDFFRKKKIIISPGIWTDITGEAHNQAFTVAQVTAADVLLDLQNSLIESMESGETLKEWKKKIRPTLRDKGWLPETAGEDRKPLPGYRLSNIWLTNISSANNAGRWKQQTKLANRRPFWEYMNPDDESTTDFCNSMSGKIFRADNPIWKKAYPPNHFRCRSTVRSLRQKDIDRKGLTVSTKLPTIAKKLGPDEGFDHDPSSAWEPDLKKYPGPLRKQVEKKLKENPYGR